MFDLFVIIRYSLFFRVNRMFEWPRRFVRSELLQDEMATFQIDSWISLLELFVLALVLFFHFRAIFLAIFLIVHRTVFWAIILSIDICLKFVFVLLFQFNINLILNCLLFLSLQLFF
jgi:hypothetical protein